MKDVVDALIEIPLGSRNKFEIDHVTGRVHLDRVLYSAMTYPAEYGMIEDTLAMDGDPLDILVISSEPTFPGCRVPARILGFLEMSDGGKPDNKLISVVDCDPRYADIHKLDDLPSFILKEIGNFFSNYKTLQDITVQVGQYHGKDDALSELQKCRQRYLENTSKL